MSIPQVAPPAPDLKEQSRRPAILLIGQDADLSESRAALFRWIGFEVTIAPYHQACPKLVRNDFAVVLFCQTIREEQALALLALLRGVQHQAIAVRLGREIGSTADHYDCTFLAPVSPELLTKQITKLHTLLRA